MRLLTLATLATMALMLVACGDDDDDKPAPQPAKVNKQYAAASAQSTIASLSATLGADPSSSAASLASVAQASQNLLQPDIAGLGGSGTQSARSALSFGIEPLALDGAGCACTATGCTFTGCSPTTASAQSSITIDGSYSWAGGHIECKGLKYTFKTNTSGTNIGITNDTTVTVNCDLTITSSNITGHLQSTGSASSTIARQESPIAYSTTWDAKTTYNNVTFTNAQPTGGSLSVSGTTTVSASGYAQSFAGSADVVFPVQ